MNSVRLKKDVNLCDSCRNGTIFVTDNGRKRIRCTMMSKWLNRKVIECSDYESRNTPMKHEYEALAWILRTDQNKGPVGFQPPSSKEYWRDKEVI